MDDRTAERDALIVDIELAFASVPRGATTLHEAERMDDYASPEERRRARARDPEQDWRDIRDVEIEACPNALSFLDPVSWRFYLPAFLRCGLRRWDSPHSVVDRAIYALDLGYDPGLAEWKRTRFATLDRDQADVVRRFLMLAARADDLCDGLVAAQALERYWSTAGAD